MALPWEQAVSGQQGFPAEIFPEDFAAAPLTTDEVRGHIANLSQQDDAAQAMTEIREDLGTALAAQAMQLSGHNHQEVRGELLAREMAWFIDVYAAILAVRQPAIALWDFDWTLAHHDGTALRPAFSFLNKKLGDRPDIKLRNGLLTSLPLTGENNLILASDVRAHLDPDLLFSSKSLEQPGSSTASLADGDDTAAKLAEVESVLDPRFVAAVQAGEVDLSKFYDPKLLIIRDLIRQHPESSFVVVDDLTYASALRRDDRLHGVWVRHYILDKYGQSYQQTPTGPALS